VKVPESGGSSTISGVEFEAWFVALKFVDAFFDDSLKVKPQGKTYTDFKTNEVKIAYIDDAHIFSKNKQEFFNIKSTAPNKKYWTIGNLKDQKVLEQLKNQHQETPDSILCFVSQSPCPIFSNILQTGASCGSRKELGIRLKTKIKEWDELKTAMSFSDYELINFSKQAKFKHIIDIDEMKEIIVSKLTDHITNSQYAPNCLFQLAIKAGKYGKTITKKEIIKCFEKNDINLKSHFKIEELTEKLTAASESLSLYSGSMILGQPIERNEVINLIEWIKAPPESNKEQIIVVTGKAGCGKTFILKNLLKKLQEEKIPVLGIKADISQYDSIKNLSDELGFSDGIKESLASIVEKYKIGVVLVDQIDALSHSMGKERKYINTYLGLISQLNYIKDLRIIISCRSFDLKFDPGLRLLEDKIKKVEIKEFSDTQVESILSRLNTDRTKISKKLYQLLKLPLHLKVFCDIFKPRINISSIKTLQDLYNELWEQKISLIAEDSIRNEVYESLDLIVEKMDSDKVITVPISLLDKKIRGRNYLSTQSIIYIQKQNIQFFHSSFFDYYYARLFITKHDSMVDLVLSQEQGLFVRSQIKQVMAYIRESNTKKYSEELQQFLYNSNIKFHIKLLVINQLAFLDNPLVEEQEIVRKLFDDNSNLIYHFIEGIQSEKWLKFLISSGYLNKFLESKNEKLINIVIWKLRYLINPYSDIIIDYLMVFPDIKNKNEYISKILLNLDHWENNKSIQLFEKHKTIIKEMRRFGFYSKLEKILLYHPDFVVTRFFDDLNRKINLIKSHKDFEKREFLEYEDLKVFEKLMKWNPKKVIPNALEIVNRLIEKTIKNNF
jgi:energy-coupling factor transporter ATP-binding protein EcfA2